MSASIVCVSNLILNGRKFQLLVFYMLFIFTISPFIAKREREREREHVYSETEYDLPSPSTSDQSHLSGGLCT